MYPTGENIPQQRLPISKKNKKWREECVEAYIGLSNTSNFGDREDLTRLYEFYNGNIDPDEYTYVLKPYGKARKNFPSQMRNYNIIKPIIDLLLGEKSKRPLNYTVTVQNSDAITEMERQKLEAIKKNYQMRFLQQLAKENPELVSQDQLPKEIPMPEEVEKLFLSTYVDQRAIMGQNALSYIMQAEEVYDKLQKAWFHFVVSGEVYSERGVRNGEPFYDILNPLDVDYDKDPDKDFVEDGDWAIVRRFMHASTIIEQEHEFLTDDQILELENPEQSDMYGQIFYKSSSGKDNIHRGRLIEHITVYWKSRARIGFLSYQDPQTGIEETIEVEDGFKMPQELKEIGASIEWVWVNQVWKGKRIDGKMYIDIAPLENQRGSMDNPAKCKLAINGRKYSDINADNISLLALGIPFQLNYNIYKYRLELSIARSKDIIAQFDINMIPKKWDIDKFMYFVEGTGIAWVDYNKEGIRLSPQHQSVLDMSIKTIQQYIMLLDSILQEWEKLSGVSRQRQGEIGAYEGKASSQQAILQSSHITEDLFRKFARFEQRDLQALVDYSKEAWLEGKKGQFVMPEGTTEFLNIDSLKYMESEYGIFVTDAGKEQQKLDNIKALVQPMVQNGTRPSVIADILDAESFSQIKQKIKEVEKVEQELAQAQQQAEAEMQQQQQMMQQQMQERELLEKEKDRQKDIEIALINAESKQDPGQSEFNLQKLMQDFETKQRELDIKEQEINQKYQSDSEKVTMDMQKAEMDMEKARMQEETKRKGNEQQKAQRNS